MEQFNLNWHAYNDHLKEMMQHLMQSNESTDVTLVCEDRTKFKAHKFVLNACSPVFQSIINDLPQKDPVVYLRGILASEMKPILQFMYLGQATFYQDRMNDFLIVSRSLEIKEICKDIDHDVPDSQNDQEYEKNIELNVHEEKNFVSPSKVEGEIKYINSKVITQRNEDGQFHCNSCDKNYTQGWLLNRHIKSAHEGIKYPCNDCEYRATTEPHLKNHIKAVHEGIKFPCDLCNSKFTSKTYLNHHIKKHLR